MSDFAKEILVANIEDEMKKSYLDYAMSVIVGRALPDIRDGLKPVHRRILYAMKDMGNDWNKPYKKSARIVGDVIGKYHPHGDSAVYDAMVRMAQDFSMRYLLVDGQGNFGSVDGDSPAAMRYTEVRLKKIAHEIMADLDKETVDFIPNYDESEYEPSVFPTKIPTLLVNGSTGIAVGMATNIPPHNLTEVINACIAMIDNPDITIDGLMQHISGPDFPTAGVINGAAGIEEAYRTGRGKILVRGRTAVETDDKNDRASIIINELPYQVNKARLQERIAELVKEKKIEGIAAIRDESDKDGMRVVIELKRGEVPEVVLNNLMRMTQLQTSFGINMVALNNGQPKLHNLWEIVDAFITHRCEVVSRRTVFELAKARNRAHILEGLAVALANIDPIIELIKSSPTGEEAKTRLLAQTWTPGVVGDMLQRAIEADGSAESPRLVDGVYQLTEKQAQAILDMRLQRLTGLEQDKIIDEYAELIDEIRDLNLILASRERLMEVIREELEQVKATFGDERRTEIVSQLMDMTTEDFIVDEEVAVTMSHAGYVKYQPVSEYRSQRRGGRGRSATRTKEEDFVDKMFVANTHDTLLCFSSKGKVYWLKVYQLPQSGFTSRGKPIVNLLTLTEHERINAILPIREYNSDQFVFLATQKGTVKKTSLEQFSRPRANGIIALDLVEGDELIGADITGGDDHAMLFTDEGKAIRFRETDVREMGRTARGVRGIRIPANGKVISLIVARQGAILTTTENGYGKRTELDQYPVKGRGGQGVIAIQTSERNGRLVGAIQVSEQDEVMLISDGGTMIRTPVNSISMSGRNTQGVKLIGVGENERLVAIDSIREDVGDEAGDQQPVDG